MKRTPFIITLVFLALVAGAYFLFNGSFNKESVNAWDLVPSDAVIVFEKNKCEECLDQVKSSSFWYVMNAALSYKKGGDSVAALIQKEIKAHSDVLVSAHVTKKDDIDFVYFISGKQTNIGVSLLTKNPKAKISQREFNEVKINSYQLGVVVFYFALIDDVWFGSFSSILVEDVIRTYRTTPGVFRTTSIGNKTFASVKDDAGNVYVQLAKLTSLFSAFNDQHKLVSSLAKSALLDVRGEDNRIVLNGFSFDSTASSEYLLSIFQHQSPVPFTLDNLVSSRSMAVASFGISDASKFTEDLTLYQRENKTAAFDSLNKLSESVKVDFNELLKTVSDEIVVSYAEASVASGVSKVALIESSAKQKWITAFTKVAAKLSVDTVFYEQYSDYEIREVPVYKFGEKLLWPMVTGFEENFYTTVGNVVVIGDNLEELKRFLDDIESEDTWGKSVSTNSFLESTLLESNVSLYVNPSKSWNYIASNLHPKWQSFIRENSKMLQAVQLSSVQFSHLNNSFYTNAILGYRPVDRNKPEANNPGKALAAEFTNGLVNLYAVRSHVNRSNEILVQDSVNDLSLVSLDGKAQWKLSIGDRIVSDVHQIDYFKNGKLQYLFATKNALHVVDRLGNYVQPFPVSMALVDIEFLNVVDWDNSKKYRFIIGDRSGKIWMVDKEGNPLDGWNPKEIGGPLAMAPRHHRIKGKDYVVAIRKDGQIIVTNRRGENLRKFPLDSEGIPAGGYFLEIGNSLSNTYFTLISADGYRVKFSLDGKIQSREALPKISVSSSFSLVVEENRKSYLILQQDSRQISITDPSGAKIITAPISTLSSSDIKYYDFGSGRTFIGIRDKAQGFVYVYDLAGNLLTTPPKEGSAFDFRPLSGDRLGIFTIQGRSLQIEPL